MRPVLTWRGRFQIWCYNELVQLSNFSKAVIPKEKLTNYVLSETHPIGKSKAKFFYTLGFDATNVNLFEKSLLRVAETEEIIGEVTTPYGTKYVIDGKLDTPVGKTVKIRTSLDC